MLSKKQGEVASAFLIDWRILDNYEFYLDDLNIPLFTFSSSEEFRKKEKIAVKEFIKNLGEKQWAEQKELRAQMLIEWKPFSVPDFINSDPEISKLILSMVNPSYKEGGEGALLIKLKKL